MGRVYQRCCGTYIEVLCIINSQLVLSYAMKFDFDTLMAFFMQSIDVSVHVTSDERVSFLLTVLDLPSKLKNVQKY